MIFTVTDEKGTQTFDGIRHALGEMPEESQFLAQVQVEGDTDFWYLENDQLALEELDRLYRMDGYDGFTIRLWSRP